MDWRQSLPRRNTEEHGRLVLRGSPSFGTNSNLKVTQRGISQIRRFRQHHLQNLFRDRQMLQSQLSDPRHQKVRRTLYRVVSELLRVVVEVELDNDELELQLLQTRQGRKRLEGGEYFVERAVGN